MWVICREGTWSCWVAWLPFTYASQGRGGRAAINCTALININGHGSESELQLRDGARRLYTYGHEFSMEAV